MPIHSILDHSVKLHGTKVAIIDGETRYTYAQSANRIKRYAAGLLALGLKPGDNIAILANNSHRYYETYHAAALAGMPLVPLNIRLAPKELEFIVGDSDAKVLILGPEYLQLYEQFAAGVPGIQQVILLEGDAGGYINYEQIITSSEPLEGPAREWGDDDMFNLSYTGGTTGLPKGVMLTPRNIMANVTNYIANCGFDDRDVWLHAAPMFHLADSWTCFAATIVGATHVFIPTFAPEPALAAIQMHRVTRTSIVPTMINALVNFPGVESYDVSSIESIIYGASPMPVDRLMAAVRLFGPKLSQSYGQTETAPFLTFMHARWCPYDGNEAGVRRLSSCGRQIPHVEVRVVDPTTGEDVRPGEVGEVIARGANVMLGYWKRPEETAHALRDGYLHTGDLATIDEENYIYIVDRAKDMIVSGGENVYSTEVENALYDHPAVLEAAAIGVPDERWGEAVLAEVVLRDSATATEREIIEHCRALIAGYKCPKRVVIRDTPLPKSGPGKILKTEIRKPYWEGHERNVN